jgi:hypothetical protein
VRLKSFSPLATLSVLLWIVGTMACGKSSGNSGGPGGFTGDFLGWTGSEDADHYFKLVRINATTGEVTTIGGTRYFRALEYGPDGTLYGIGSSLYAIDPTTGVETLIGSFHTATESGILMAGAAFSPSGTLYVRTNGTDEMYTVSLADGALTYVGTPSALIEDLEFSSGGTLYASFAHLFALNPMDMSTKSDIGSFGGLYVGMMTYGDGERLYAMDYNPSTTLSTIDVSTALLTPITAVQSAGISSLVAERVTAMPNRATLAHAPRLPAPSDAELREMEAEARADSARHRALFGKAKLP